MLIKKNIYARWPWCTDEQFKRNWRNNSLASVNCRRSPSISPTLNDLDNFHHLDNHFSNGKYFTPTKTKIKCADSVVKHSPNEGLSQ